AAMVKDEVGEADASKFTDWQDAYRKAIGTTTMPDDDLATQYEQVADGLVKLKRDFNLAALLRTLAGFEKFGMLS
ncbi:MAG: hypothetical protein QF918_13455, partial [Pirellulaceae bacterium]|nr:hypothetical protein [Pirellulaceae bacterium]